MTTETAAITKPAIRARERGFTVVELLIAFSLLAMAAGSLFNMFIVAGRNNDRTFERDMAMMIAVNAAEAFKAEPAMYATDGGVDALYDASFELLASAPSNASGGIQAVAMAEASRSAAYVMHASAAVAGGVSSKDVQGGYAEGAAELKLGADRDHRLVARRMGQGGGVTVTLDGLPVETDARFAADSLDVSIAEITDGMTPKRLTVINSTGMPMSVNVFGAPNGADTDEYLSVAATDGEVSIVFIGEGAGRANSRRYDFVAIVSRLSDSAGGTGASAVGNSGNAVVARVEAAKYEHVQEDAT